MASAPLIVAPEEARGPDPSPRIAWCDASDRSEWDGYVASSEAASLYHVYAWRDVVERAFGHESHYLCARNAAGRIVGVLPMVRLKSILFGDFLVSMPYFNYGGIVADDEVIAGALAKAAARHAASLGVSHLELRHDRALLDWPVRSDKVSMLLELPDASEELWKRLGSKLRSQVKRPQKEGATCVSGGIELLDDFYAVFARNMRDLGTPVYGRGFFRHVIETFHERTRLFVVRLRGAPVAAGLVIGRRSMLEIPWASSLRSANHVGVNMLLYWSVLEYACDAGYDHFDFGRSTVDAGAYRFKKQWGATAKSLHWHYWLKHGGKPPTLNPSNPKYRLAIAAWRRLPLWLANRIGPRIVRNLP
ncbi:MAG TPA: FemAB family XrtA/PEP-CTERM system-associated protein [Steroidobacter sp.]|nr:FemAB family PEP-CTERM system-associated protein [Steroidobacteraceae bacterium]HLS82404.1 FemAB family XrtA/PEP-CTERM system-associated protein [Steroidobacter sp.]